MAKQVKTIIHHCDDCGYIEYHTNEWGGNHHFGCYHEKVLGKEIIHAYKTKAEQGIEIPNWCPLADVKCPIENKKEKES